MTKVALVATAVPRPCIGKIYSDIPIVVSRAIPCYKTWGGGGFGDEVVFVQFANEAIDACTIDTRRACARFEMKNESRCFHETLPASIEGTFDIFVSMDFRVHVLPNVGK